MAESLATAPHEYDVYLSYPSQEEDWALRLVEDLSKVGVRCFSDLTLKRRGDPWSRQTGLERSRILVVLWSGAVSDAPGMLDEIMKYNELLLRGDKPRTVFTVMLGGLELLSRAPEVLASHHAFGIERAAYAAGPNGNSEGWQTVIKTIRDLAYAVRLDEGLEEGGGASATEQADASEHAQAPREQPAVAPVAIGPPSAHVHADRWTTEDQLDYALYAKAIAEFIRHPDAKPPMVISVQAPWGQGKTSLMRMVQEYLDSAHPDLEAARAGRPSSSLDEQSSELTFATLRDSLGGDVPLGDVKPEAIRTVWFNAWKYQSSEQIWAGLAHAILAQLPARLSVKARELFWLRLQRRRIDPSAVREDIHRAAFERFLPKLVGIGLLVPGVLVTAGVALLVEGLGAFGVGVVGTGTIGALWLAWRAWAAATAEALKRPLEGAYLRYVRQPDYSGKLGYLHLVEEDMANALELLTPDDQPAVIFIDDLDRCSPAKIGEVIEAVNLFLAGEYPNCAFVIGIDAEVVAASMEVVHAPIIDKLGARSGELGWRFMDKFVQLPFVMPRLQAEQRDVYLRGLFATPRAEDAQEVLIEAERLEADSRALSVDEFARRVGDLAPRLAAVQPDRARNLGERVVAAGARAFSDKDPEVIDALADQMAYLSDNPRTIKRAVNLYRFHRFTAFARQTSTQSLAVATPAQIGRWIVVIVRWPQLVRWLQTQREQSADGEDPVTQLLALAASTTDVSDFREAILQTGVEAAWTGDLELLEFLREPTAPQLRLDLAGPCGLW